jgi:hypothetical protein
LRKTGTGEHSAPFAESEACPRFARLILLLVRYRNFGDTTLAGEGHVEIAISETIIGEVVRVLGDKFEWPNDRLQATELALRELCTVVTPPQTLAAVKDDPTITGLSNALWKRAGKRS